MSARPANFIDTITRMAQHRPDAGALLTGRGWPADYRRILVPVCFSPACEDATRAALRLSACAQVVLLHAFQPEEERMQHAPHGDIGFILSLRRKARDTAVQRMHALVQALEQESRLISCAVHHGPAEPVICAYAYRFQADLIVLGGALASPGAFERRIANRTGCDVLIVPHGHERPS